MDNNLQFFQLYDGGYDYSVGSNTAIIAESIGEFCRHRKAEFQGLLGRIALGGVVSDRPFYPFYLS
ncbi:MULTISPECIES: hypothetical protein [unclassified Leptolyngbya]|uniref:hypothetical protein n=1 Tax=unclassified Leptolyngbya TaxID=2650499 RepID=UPI0016822259|nr:MULTISPECIES: hypothetical protein [unclassified Leptolyngbya]MBD1909998.1 hypothetical protein [Leptolyngbya sp. FACHB-8]MBD2157135.1 hypothetical protein [Leptolyngbya sp. FACHB-16]